MTQQERIKRIKQLNEGQDIDNLGDICHYTDAVGLYGILTSESIWFTEKGFLNDITEENYWSSLVEESLAEFRSHTPFLRDDILQLLYNVLHRKNDFIFSCTTEIDVINQWNLYSPDGGYALVFSSQQMKESLQTSGSKVSLSSVIYDTEFQKVIIDYLIERFYTCYIINGLEYPGVPKFDTDVTMDQLSWFTSYYKQCNHSSEKEIRFIYNPKNPKIKHRISRGIITPYIKLKVSSLPIKKILIGPKIKDKSAFLGLQSLLNSIGKDNVEISYSKLHMR